MTFYWRFWIWLRGIAEREAKRGFREVLPADRSETWYLVLRNGEIWARDHHGVMQGPFAGHRS